MLAKQLISDSLMPLRTSDTGADALIFMDEYRVSHLPIVNNQEFLGLISDSDVYNRNNFDEPVGDHQLSLSQAYVFESQHIYDVIRTFASLKLTVLPVLDEKKNYLGCITLGKLVQAMAEMAALNNPGGIIVLEINEKDYVLTEIARIVESNDAKILSLYITSYSDSTKMDVTLKVNRIDVGAILQTFSRFNYIIKASFTEDTYFENIKERFDSLMNYLNI
ncbi:MAG TPA: CBS domain-containing protein [Bacteroidales bacterium]|nr:CBS domain-containing protein [Bacteroidales bacterium]